DRPFWTDTDPTTGRDVMSMTLTDRLTRGTYLFDNGPERPGVICLSYTWMSDALKVLPHPVDRRVELALAALKKIYPDLDIA
ncbi:amine oxidase, partial [Mycobacterium tuberculosis]|nr:amine oxidase [Mycobacterium tuberculosis]